MWRHLGPRLEGRPLLVAAGPGHNGGDALVLARHALAAGVKDVTIWVPILPLKPLTARQLRALKAWGVVIRRGLDRFPAREGAVVVEGLAGIGRLEGPLREAAQRIAQHRGPIWAVDVPCGLREGSLFTAQGTLGVRPLKRELFYPLLRPAVGEIFGVDLPWPPRVLREAHQQAAWLWDAEDLKRLLGRLRPWSWSHKGTRGRLGVVAGQLGMLGAGALASRAAALVGGVVEWFVPDTLIPTAHSLVPQAVVRPRQVAILQERLPHLDAILLGPGLDPQEAEQWVDLLLAGDTPLVLDAGALLPGLLSRPRRCALVLTPHPGEWARLRGLSVEQALTQLVGPVGEGFSERTVLVLKSTPLWIHGQGLHVVDMANPGLAFGGCGDVLAGFLVGFAPACAHLEEAALAACALQQLAGQLLAREGTWPDPSRLLEGAARILGGLWYA